jgi:V8-like Glu-specific endopeptidase
VSYKTNTDGGSSGSPCFDQDWNLVALHHSGDPNYALGPNEGIPIDAIVTAIQSRGIQVN